MLWHDERSAMWMAFEIFMLLGTTIANYLPNVE